MKWDTFQSVAGALILGGTSDTQKMSTFGVVDSQNWSAFGQVEFDLAERWTLVTGLRWSQDDKDLDMRRVYEDVPEGSSARGSLQHRRCRDPGNRHHRLRRLRGAAQLNWKPVDGHAALRGVQPRHQGRQLVARSAGRRRADENLKHGRRSAQRLRARAEDGSVGRRGAAQHGGVLLRLRGLSGVLDRRSHPAGDQFGCEGARAARSS